jgi:cation diffusion facilitator CzcD-associated flavoprotein CzcO
MTPDPAQNQFEQRRSASFSQPETFPQPAFEDGTHVHVAIVGAGFSGLGMAIRLKQEGYQDFVVLERATDPGGTWRENTYPGCACDIPSNLYSFSFAPNPNWSHLYPPQPEILDYLHDCIQRFEIAEHMRWQCELLKASWQEKTGCWLLATTQGTLRADILIAGQGPLAEPSLPHLPGLNNFTGTLFHSAQWRHDYDLQGKRVAVIGTGASAIQFVPQIQPLVSHLTLFQRTPPWIMPRGDYQVSARRQRLFRRLPLTQRLARAWLYWTREVTVLGFVYHSGLLKGGARIAQRHLAQQVANPDLRARLTPHYTLGCKRVLVSDDFYPAVCQPNVEVVTEAIHEIRAQSIVTTSGQEYTVDAIICGTGFHVTDTTFLQRIYGQHGLSLAEQWQTGISAYRGTTVVNFPNLFLMIGPNTGLGHNSMIFMIESQISYILNCLSLMQRRHVQAVSVLPEKERAFNKALQERMRNTVWVSGCTSWYLDANGCNTAIWPDFTFAYWRQMRHFDLDAYQLSPGMV